MGVTSITLSVSGTKVRQTGSSQLLATALNNIVEPQFIDNIIQGSNDNFEGENKVIHLVRERSDICTVGKMFEDKWHLVNE